MLVIRPASSADAAGIWSILEPEIRGGETFALPQDMPEADALNYWRQRDHETLVAEQNGQILGSYYLRANQKGGGGHVANAGYLTAAAARGRGVARAMLEDSFKRAKVRGFAAMQFNFVVSSNERALKTWEAYGFRVVGRLPLAFRHPTLGLIDALVMYKDL